MRAVRDSLFMVGLFVAAATIYWWDEVKAIVKVVPTRVDDSKYTTTQITPTTAEHIRILRHGRYLTVCYWVTASKTGATVISHCHTERELFNGY